MLGAPLGTVLAQLHKGRKLFEKAMWDYAAEHGLLGEARDDHLRRGGQATLGVPRWDLGEVEHDEVEHTWASVAAAAAVGVR